MVKTRLMYGMSLSPFCEKSKKQVQPIHLLFVCAIVWGLVHKGKCFAIIDDS